MFHRFDPEGKWCFYSKAVSVRGTFWPGSATLSRERCSIDSQEIHTHGSDTASWAANLPGEVQMERRDRSRNAFSSGCIKVSSPSVPVQICPRSRFVPIQSRSRLGLDELLFCNVVSRRVLPLRAIVILTVITHEIIAIRSALFPQVSPMHRSL